MNRNSLDSILCECWICKYFDCFGFEHIPKEIRKFIGNKNIITDIYRLQAYDSITCEYVCVGFIDFMSKGKSMLDNTNLFSPDEYKKNNQMLLPMNVFFFLRIEF